MSLGVAALAAVLAGGVSLLGQAIAHADEPQPASRPSDEGKSGSASAPETDKTASPPKTGKTASPPKTGKTANPPKTGKTASPPKTGKKAPDLVKPTKALAPLLKRYDDEAEPSRELKRALLSVLHYLFERDVERVLPYFHPELRMHTGGGDLEPVSAKQLKELFESQRDAPRPGGGKPLAELAKLETLTLLSRDRLARAKPKEELAKGFRVDPRRVLPHMREGDWVAMLQFKRAEGIGAECFYVFRRHAKRYKVVLAE